MSGTQSYLFWLSLAVMGENGCQNAENLMAVKIQMVPMVFIFSKAFLMSLSALLFICFSLARWRIKMVLLGLFCKVCFYRYPGIFPCLFSGCCFSSPNEADDISFYQWLIKKELTGQIDTLSTSYIAYLFCTIGPF